MRSRILRAVSELDSPAAVLATTIAGVLSAALLVWFLERDITWVLMASAASAFLISCAFLGVSVLWRIRSGTVDRASSNASTADARPEFMAHAVTTLSERLEQVQSERDEAQSDYRSIFDNSLAGIYQIDGAGRILLANPAFAKMLGFESEKELMSTVRDAHQEIFVDPEHRVRFFSSTDDEGFGVTETEVRTKDRRRLWILESSRRMHEDGEFVCCEGIVFDITPRKKAALALRRLSAQLMEVQDEERRRLARELHDSMGQLLAAIEMNLTRLEDTMELDPDASSILQDSLKLCREASRQTRSTSHLLHPPLLEELGLEHAVREFASGYEKRSRIDLTVEVEELGRLPRTLETSLFRFLQECLTNVHRHSGSKRAIVRLFRRHGGVVAEVEDFGTGVPEDVLSGADESRTMGVGLPGLRARLEQLNGELFIRSSSSGTTVSGFVPLDEPEAGIEAQKKIPSRTE